MKKVFIIFTFAVSVSAQTNSFSFLQAGNLCYTNAKIVRTDPAFAFIISDNGGAKISFTNLPASIQQQYHYDPQAAADYLKKKSEASFQENSNAIARAEKARANWIARSKSAIRFYVTGRDKNTGAYFAILNHQSNEIYIDGLSQNFDAVLNQYTLSRTQAEADFANASLTGNSTAPAVLSGQINARNCPVVKAFATGQLHNGLEIWQAIQ